MTIFHPAETETHLSSADDLLLESPPRRKILTRRNAAIAGAFVLAVAGASVGTWLGTRTSGSSSSAISVTTETVAATTGTMKETDTASGTLAPAENSTLTFGVSGTVTAVDVSTGQTVKAGQTLATLNSTALSDVVAADQATVTSDQDKLATDQADGALTSQIDTDQASIASAEAQLATAETNLSDATLRATFAGTVAAVNLAVGDQVSAGSSGSSGSSGSGANSAFGSAASSSSSSSQGSGEGITVISANNYLVDTTVDDTEVGQVKVGDQAVITVTGSSSEIYGTVSSVSLIASSSSSTSSSVASFPVVITVTGSPSGLYAGAAATVSIVVEQINNAVEVPTAAITYTTGSPTVTEVVNGKDVTQAVTTGITASGETQITGGLKAGDKVVERVVRFNGTSGTGGSRSIFGTGSTGTRSGTGGFGGTGSGGSGITRTGGGG